jgi:sec-independent protein translocase protein TatB
VFDIGFSEMILLAVVALIVLGPERLPKAARTAGELIGRLQRYVSGVKADIERELQLEELKKLQSQIEAQARELQETMRRQAEDVQAPLRQSLEEARQALAVEDGASFSRSAPGQRPSAEANEPVAGQDATTSSAEVPSSSVSTADMGALPEEEKKREPLVSFPGAGSVSSSTELVPSASTPQGIGKASS